MGYMNALIDSCRKFGYDLHVLGEGEKWGGWAWRARKYRSFAASQDPKEWIFVVDAYDVVMLRSVTEDDLSGLDPEAVITGAVSTDTLFRVLAAERFAGRRISYSKHGYNELCFGTLLGRASAVVNLFDSMDLERPDFDDQEECVRMYKKGSKLIRLDSKREFFATVFTGSLRRERLRIEGSKLYSESTRTYPVAIHGINNANLDKITSSLKLPRKQISKKGSVAYRVSKGMYHFKRTVSRSPTFRLLVVAGIVGLITIPTLVVLSKSVCDKTSAKTHLSIRRRRPVDKLRPWKKA